VIIELIIDRTIRVKNYKIKNRNLHILKKRPIILNFTNLHITKIVRIHVTRLGYRIEPSSNVYKMYKKLQILWRIT